MRGDIAYAREDIMRFCEEQHRVDYVFVMATNHQLKLRAKQTIEKVKNDYEQRLEPVTELMDSLFPKEEELEEIPKLVPNSTWFRSLIYQTEKS